jgi:hypothetical protein
MSSQAHARPALRPPLADLTFHFVLKMNTHATSAFRELNIGDPSALTALLDEIEMDVMRELIAASPTELVRRDNLRLFESDDGVGALMYFNRWMRLGIDRPATPEGIANAIEWLRINAGNDWSIDLSPLATPSRVPEGLTMAGLRASQTATQYCGAMQRLWLRTSTSITK